MASFRRTAIALTIIAAAGCAGLTDAAAQSTFNRCPKADQYADVVKQLVTASDRSRALAEDNPLLLADVAFYDYALDAARRCNPTVAAVSKPIR